MINEVDESLRSVLRAEVVNATDVEVVFDAPTRDWASRRSRPTLDLYLYDIREDLRLRQTGIVETRDDRGMVTERQPLPRFFKLAYLITAWTQRPEDEHRLLSAALATFIKYDIIPQDYLTPLLVELAVPVSVRIAYPLPEAQQVPDVWNSLGGDLKPSLDLVTTVPVRPDLFYDVAQAVMAPLRLHSSAYNTINADDGVRQLRDPASEPPPAPSTAPAVAPADGKPASTRAPRRRS
jgi:Pvc16 N-terminal domain